ncbi:MAG: FHA domain-containing protein [Ruminococcus sp.]|nr:FHA domain-containing protein [Ruminococcus sp.]HRR76035.1 FHA domain-containing protein [Ruminococcus sp.]
MKICSLKKIAPAVAAAAIITLSSLVPSSFSTAADEGENEYVNNDKSGIIQVEVWYQPVGKEDICLRTGTAFLINHTTALTSAELITINNNIKDSISAVYSIDPEHRYEFDESCLHYEIAMPDDEKISASPSEIDEFNDFAVITLDAQLSDNTPLWLGDSDELAQTADVFALGFPTAMDKYVQNPNYAAYFTDDVTVTKGTVTTTGFAFSDYRSSREDLIQHNAVVGAGNAGGPLVDSKGTVVGMNTIISFDESLSYATSINKVKNTLDELGIKYNDPDWKPDSVTSKKSGKDKRSVLIPIIIGGIILSAALIAVLLVILLSKNRKRSLKVPAIPSQPVAPEDIPAPIDNYTSPAANASLSSVRPEEPENEERQYELDQPTVYANQGSAETAVLRDSGNNFYMNIGGKTLLRPMIIRKRSGLSVRITSADFVIGKENSKVDYCIHNNAVSRRHARITVTAGHCFITDLGSSNYTYVNGRRLPPDTPQMLRNGDMIRLADEEFEFRI